MQDLLQPLIQEYQELLDHQRFNPEELNYGILKYHIALLETIDAVDSGCVSVFDLYKRQHIYYSPKYEKLLGWDSNRAQHDLEYTNNLIHPEDLVMLYKAAIFSIRLGFSIQDPGQLKEYKTVFDYRVRTSEGQYVRIIEQQMPLELDPSGNVWLALSMVDLSPENDLTMAFRGRLKNIRTGDLFYFPPHKGLPGNADPLTNREKEILKLIAGGLISKEIADRLYISVNTVNTHRQRIIEKLNVSNTYEAIKYATERGFFI